MSLFQTISNIKLNRRIIIFLLALLTISILAFCFISSNEAYYNRPVAKITSITVKASSTTKDGFDNVETIRTQEIKAIIMNGLHKGKEINLENKTSDSQVYDLNLKVKDEVLVTIKEDSQKNIISCQIVDLKRDKYIAYMVILFVLLILLVGGSKGFRSLSSVILNILIFSAAIGLFLKGYNILITASLASILFIVVSISIVSGINKKTFSAIIGTIAGTFISMLIAVIVMQITHSSGMHYEEMEFLTNHPENIFFVEILVGTLGAIMDIAISISSSINELYDNNPSIDRKALIHSGKEIGKDIMGTMSNTLVFAYISGSIPLILLMLRNEIPISYIVSINLSLEIVRALTGSIGIVISIPITIYISVLLLKKYKTGEL